MDNMTKEQFKKDVSNHKMEIVSDNGLYRHLVCSKGSFDYKFEIVTWPGHLSISGDMGDFVFSRVDDMFKFFRRDDGDINSGYWSQKVTAQSVFGGGIERFDVELFRQRVLEDVREHLDIKEGVFDLPDDIQEEIAPLLEASDEWECVEAIRNFRSEKLDFSCFFECSVKVKTYQYLWCCYAIVWAIAQYDLAKAGKEDVK